MGDAGAAFGSSMDFMSQRIAEQKEAQQRDIDRMREDLYNAQQQRNWQTQFDYQKELNNTQMAREDNAVQRSVADHQAAGFNKLLAVGNQSAAGGMTTFGGSAGGGVSSQIPQSRETNFLQLAQVIMDNKVKQSMISKSKAEADYTNQKTLSEIENTGILSIRKLREEIGRTKDIKEKEYLEKQIEEIQTRIDTARHNLGLGRTHNLPVGTDPRVNNPWQAGSHIINTLEDNEVINNLKDDYKDYKPNPKKRDAKLPESIEYDGKKWYKKIGPYGAYYGDGKGNILTYREAQKIWRNRK